MIATTHPARVHLRERRAWQIGARVVLVGLAVWAGFRLLIGWWTSLEAAVVMAAFRSVGVHGAHRIGEQIIIDRPEGGPFLANVGPLCSSLGLVLAFAAVAGFGVSGSRRRRFQAFARGATLVVVGNLVRIAATVLVGIRSGPASLESFHDGVATGFAVAFVLAGAATFVLSLPMFTPTPIGQGRSHPSRSTRRPGRP